MFHLLVAYQGWPDRAGSIPTSRVYMKTDEPPGSYFLTDGKIDINKVAKIPALLVTETGGSGPQVARVAHIRALTVGPKDTAIQYAIDASVPTISNRNLEAFADELGISACSGP